MRQLTLNLTDRQLNLLRSITNVYFVESSPVADCSTLWENDTVTPGAPFTAAEVSALGRVVTATLCASDLPGQLDLIPLVVTLSPAAAERLRVEAVDNLKIDIEENGEMYDPESLAAANELVSALRAALDAAGVKS